MECRGVGTGRCAKLLPIGSVRAQIQREPTRCRSYFTLQSSAVLQA